MRTYKRTVQIRNARLVQEGVAKHATFERAWPDGGPRRSAETEPCTLEDLLPRGVPQAACKGWVVTPLGDWKITVEFTPKRRKE